MSLNGKTALVTGASRGIGRAIALRLAEDGANVAVIYAGSADKAKAVVNEITALGVNAKAYRCNVADSAAVNETVKAVTNDLGKIDILVNNAGHDRKSRRQQSAFKQHPAGQNGQAGGYCGGSGVFGFRQRGVHYGRSAEGRRRFGYLKPVNFEILRA